MKPDLLLKKDFIVKEELQRSVVVYFISFLFILVLGYGGYIPGDALGTFTLAFILTAVHFMFMVWYRKKEPLIDP